jgi:hypothetical protein
MPASMMSAILPILAKAYETDTWEFPRWDLFVY